MSANTLKDIDRAQLAKYERTIEQGKESLIEMAFAFEAIRDTQLWRVADGRPHDYWDYCYRRWRLEKTQVFRVIKVGKTIREMYLSGSNGQESSAPADGSEKLLPFPPPAKQTQAIELAKVQSPEKRLEVWEYVVAEHGTTATAKQVKQAAEMMVPALKAEPAFSRVAAKNALKDRFVRLLDGEAWLTDEERERFAQAFMHEWEWL